MTKLSFEEIIAAARELPPAQKAALVQTLQAPELTSPSDSPTREELIAELSALRAAGAFDHVESLYGKYANSGMEVSAEELHTTIREAATAWESELDEFSGDND